MIDIAKYRGKQCHRDQEQSRLPLSKEKQVEYDIDNETLQQQLE